MYQYIACPLLLAMAAWPVCTCSGPAWSGGVPRHQRWTMLVGVSLRLQARRKEGTRVLEAGKGRFCKVAVDCGIRGATDTAVNCVETKCGCGCSHGDVATDLRVSTDRPSVVCVASHQLATHTTSCVQLKRGANNAHEAGRRVKQRSHTKRHSIFRASWWGTTEVSDQPQRASREHDCLVTGDDLAEEREETSQEARPGCGRTGPRRGCNSHCVSHRVASDDLPRGVTVKRRAHSNDTSRHMLWRSVLGRNASRLHLQGRNALRFR